MKIEFTLKQAQFVTVEYSFICSTQNNKYVISRVMIDGNEKTRFRKITSNQFNHTNDKEGKVWLGKGKHLATVDFRTDSPTMSCWSAKGGDYTGAYFIIKYFKLKR